MMCTPMYDSFLFCTYESHEEKHDLESPPDGGDTGDVSVPNGGHGHHEEVDALPVGELLAILKIRGVARVLKLLH